MNQRVSVLITRDGSVLLMRRIKDGREYFVIPGGGVEAGESIEDAARREVLEELSLTLDVGPVLWREQNNGRMETVVKAAGVTGVVTLGGPELQKQSPSNQYYPTWVPFSHVRNLGLVPESAKVRIVDLAERGQL